MNALVRTAEHPPSQHTLAECLCSLLAVLNEKNAFALIIDLVVPQLIDIDFVDVFPLNDPLAVLTDLLKKDGAQEVHFVCRCSFMFRLNHDFCAQLAKPVRSQFSSLGYTKIKRKLLDKVLENQSLLPSTWLHERA